MSLETVSHHYGMYFSELSYPERWAAIRYIDELSRLYPNLAADATAGPGNEGMVYVYAPVPAEDDQNIVMYEALADVAIDILLDIGVSIALMPGPELGRLNWCFAIDRFLAFT